MRGMWILGLAIACGEDTTAVNTVDLETRAQEFVSNRSISGSFGYELVGHGSLFYSNDFVDDCLRENELGWMETVGVMFRGDRTSYFMTNYEAQQYITQTTDDGYCLYMGEDLSVEFTEVVEESEGRELEANPYTIRWSLNSANPSPYFECLAEQVLSPSVTTYQNLEEPAALSLFDNACQGMPAPYDREEAGGEAYPSTEAPRAPTTDEVRALLEDFDEALASRDLEAALDYVQCYNLELVTSTELDEDETEERQPDEAAIGACIPSDLLDTGPAFESSDDDWLIPWLEGHITSSTEILEPVLEENVEPANLYHVELADTEPDPELGPIRRRGNKSISVQWVNGEWKLVGVVEYINSGTTPVRFVNDLHGDIFVPMIEGGENPWDWQVRRWFVFWDRLRGYPINDIGCPAAERRCTEEHLAAFNSQPGRRIRPLR